MRYADPRRWGAAACIGACVVIAASCADTTAGSTAPDDASVRAPSDDAPIDASDATTPDVSSCDASDPGCAGVAIACEDAAWCQVPAPLNPAHVLTAVWGWSANDVLAVGSGGTVLRWNGASWSPLPSPAGKQTFFTVWGTGAADMWLASGTDALFHATSLVGGAPEWKAVPDATASMFSGPPVFAMWGSGAGDMRIGCGRFLSSTPEGFVESNQVVRPGANDPWVVLAGQGDVRAIWGSSATDVWVVVDNSENDPWQKGMTVHGTGPSPDGLTWMVIDSQAAVGLNAVWGSSAADVWTVGELGVIRRFTAGAERWSVVASPTSATLRGIWGSGPNDVWAVGNAGTILHWDGSAWTTSVAAFALGRKPDLYAVWGAGPDDVWIVGDGVVLRSIGGKRGRP